jgi:1-acyl-sn-glycerol-3-phosphate acyltransferase
MSERMAKVTRIHPKRQASASEPSVNQLEDSIKQVSARLDQVSRTLESELKKLNTDAIQWSVWYNEAVRLAAAISRIADFRTFFQAEEVDEFGLDIAFEEKIEPFFDFFFEKYWRIDVQGVEHIPADGRVLLVGNHSGTLPWDAMMIKMAVRKKHPAARDVRFLVEDFVYHFPFLGTSMYRIGGVRACPENAQRLLSSDSPLLVFPEGVKGLGKLYSERYRLQRFGRGGFVKICMKTGSPIVPVAVIGAEEIHPIIYKMGWFARALGVPYIPVTPTFPLLGPLGMIPLPTKWTIQFGEPIPFDQYTPMEQENPILINRLAEQVRRQIQSMIAENLKKRVSIWS